MEVTYTWYMACIAVGMLNVFLPETQYVDL